MSYTETRIDFLRHRRACLVVSVLLIAVGLGEVFFGGPLNFGIDLAGGHQMNVVFRQAVSTAELRDRLDGQGIALTIQPFGEDERSFLFRAPLSGDERRDLPADVARALTTLVGNPVGGFDLNRVGTTAVAEWLASRDQAVIEGTLSRSDAAEALRTSLEPLTELRRDRGVIGDWSELEEAGLDGTLLSRLRDGGAEIGGFAIVGQESVGPQVGSELRSRALLAVVLSMLGIALYIWWRFELPFAVGAIVATLHDVAVVIGLYVLVGFEINLTTVAALLTLVGYSVNDTVVVFDRVRENRRGDPRTPMLELMNLSLNQTLTRTIMTSGTTLLAAGSLLFLGGDVLRGFSFVLVVGVIVGTYSSVYIASPVALLFFQRRERSHGQGRSSSPVRTAPRAA